MIRIAFEYPARNLELFFGSLAGVKVYALNPMTLKRCRETTFVDFNFFAPHCKDAAVFSALTGMAPVTEQSGNTRKVYRRLRCDHFLR